MQHFLNIKKEFFLLLIFLRYPLNLEHCIKLAYLYEFDLDGSLRNLHLKFYHGIWDLCKLVHFALD